MITKNHRQTLLVATVLLVAPSLAWGSGFALFEHGNRAMAMGGAFTAVADDPSALFWNPAGMAFQTDRGVQLMAGVVLIKPEQTFLGEDPYPGAGYVASQITQTFYPPHLYFAYPVSDRVMLSASVNTPFGLGTWWEDDFAGRFLSKRAELQVMDLGVNLAYLASDNVGVAIGVDYMNGKIDLTRNAGLINPFNQRLTDVAQAHLYTTGMNTAFAWNAGLLWKLGGGFSIGGLYRSGFTIDFEGKGSFVQLPTGYAELDAAVSGIFPFDDNVPITTSVDFPSFWSVGLAWANERLTISGQYAVMGWSSFDELTIVFPENPIFSSVVREEYENSKTYRFGLEWRLAESWAVQLGYLDDETGQPIEAMSPLLGDGNRKGPSAGISWMTEKFRIDIGYLYLDVDSRSTEGGSWDGFEGRYTGKAHLAGASFSVKF